MVKLYNAADGVLIGDITDEQLAFLQEQFEEEWSGDQDYYVNGDTVEMLESAGADAALLGLLRRAIGTAGEADVRWSAE